MANDIAQILEQAARHCDTSGGRLTQKRRVILEILLENDQPQSAYEIAHLYLAKSGDTIPAMSVYRMLDFLMEKGLVHKLASTNKFLACSHITCNHAHPTPQFLICDSCHSVNELGLDHAFVTALEKTIDAKHFQLNSPQLELHGVCESCQEQS